MNFEIDCKRYFHLKKSNTEPNLIIIGSPIFIVFSSK